MTTAVAGVMRIRVGLDGRYRVVVPDHAAGSRGRYTVYSLPAAPSGEVLIIGRELDIGEAERVAYGPRTAAEAFDR